MKNIKRLIRNQRGDAFLVAMVTVGISVISSMLMMSYSLQVEAGSKRPRVKSMMSSIEAKVRSVLLNPANYNNCASSDAGNVRSSCVLKTNLVTSLTTVMPDAKCSSSKQSCGIRVEMMGPLENNLSISGQIYTRAKVRISYEGKDFPMKDLEVIVDVPADILQTSGIYKCPQARPKFKGFLPDGRMNCESLSPQLGVNQFVTGVDPGGLATTSATLPTSDISCSSGQFFERVQWTNGGNNIATSCADRRNPFTMFGFTPKNGTGGDVTYTPVP